MVKHIRDESVLEAAKTNLVVISSSEQSSGRGSIVEARSHLLERSVCTCNVCKESSVLRKWEYTCEISLMVLASLLVACYKQISLTPNANWCFVVLIFTGSTSNFQFWFISYLSPQSAVVILRCAGNS